MERKWYRSPALLVALALIGVLAWREHQLSTASARMFRHDLQASQLLVPTKPAQNPNYAFENVDDRGQPVRFDPCHVIHYVVRVGPGPADGVAFVQEGVAKLSAATGLTFHYDGPTDEVPAKGFEPRGDPVWIGWAATDETTAFARVKGGAPDAVGVGGPVESRRPGGPMQYVGGSAMLRPTNLEAPGFGPGSTEGNVLLHELGHLVGLAHVADPTEVMHPGTSSATSDGYDLGDLNGLWRLGTAGGCL